jgi:hypothetical protein
MKRETLRHPKTFDLASRLGIDRARALGILTLLWDWTTEVAVQGDIGKWSNGSIARACEWTDDPDAFVAALVGAVWLDEDEMHRLIIHDWPDHCERWVRSKLKSMKLEFLPCYGDVPKSASGDASRDVSADPPHDRTEPNLPEPNRTERTADRSDVRPAEICLEPGGDRIVLGSTRWRESAPTRERIARVVSGDPGITAKKLRPADLELCIRAAAVAHYAFDLEWLGKILSSMQARRTPLENRWAFFRTALIESAKRMGRDYHAAEDSVVIPSRQLSAEATT